jgi:multidrug resistance efflux pump
MKPVTILIAAAALAASVATAQAQVPHQRADGLWVCPNDETRVIVSGDWRVVCYSNVPSISRREFDAAREQYQRADAERREREQKFNRESGRCNESPRPSSCND